MYKPIPGDIYQITLHDGGKRFFQYVAKDASNMKTDVIRIFKLYYQPDEFPSAELILSDEVEYCLCTSINLGVTNKVWKKYNHSDNIGNLDYYFRTSLDYGRFPGQKVVSNNWTVWQINKERIFVGKLPKQYHNAYIGGIYLPNDVVERIETGVYESPFYPTY